MTILLTINTNIFYQIVGSLIHLVINQNSNPITLGIAQTIP